MCARSWRPLGTLFLLGYDESRHQGSAGEASDPPKTSPPKSRLESGVCEGLAS